MDTRRLRNLLQEFDKRLGKLGKVAAVSAPLQTSETARLILRLRADVQRYIGKTDTLRLRGVEELEELIAQLRSTTLTDSRAHSTFAFDVDGLTNLTSGLRIGLNQLGPEDVLEAVPGQKLAAFTFDFDEESLVVADQPFIPAKSESDMALAALETAIEHGEHVEHELAATNASPRLKHAFTSLQATLVSHSNVVQAGVKAQICSRMVNADVEEMSATLTGLLIAHIETVFAALAQFQDWRAFCENAVQTNVNFASVKRLSESAESLIKGLNDEPSIDRSVIDALATSVRWVTEPDQPDKRDVLSLSRVLENLWAITSRTVLGVTHDLVSEARKGTARMILSALLVATAGVIPILGKVPGAEWVQAAYTYFTANGGSSAPN